MSEQDINDYRIPGDLWDKPYAFKVGYLAKSRREPMKSNPFGPTAGYDSSHWRMGWREAKRRKAFSMTEEERAELADGFTSYLDLGGDDE